MRERDGWEGRGARDFGSTHAFQRQQRERGHHEERRRDARPCRDIPRRAALPLDPRVEPPPKRSRWLDRPDCL